MANGKWQMANGKWQIGNYGTASDMGNCSTWNSAFAEAKEIANGKLKIGNYGTASDMGNCSTWNIVPSPRRRK